MNAGMEIERVKAVKAAMRDVLCRCICREVGFNDKGAYERKIRQVFSSYLQQEPDIIAQMMHAFHREARLLGFHCVFAIPIAFTSAAAHQRLRLRRPRGAQLQENGIIADAVDLQETYLSEPAQPAPIPEPSPIPVFRLQVAAFL